MIEAPPAGRSGVAPAGQAPFNLDEQAPLSLDEQALFREARRLRRRRWAIGILIAAVLLGSVVAVAELTTSRTRAHAAASSAGGASGGPNGPLAKLGVAGALAVGPAGTLYVADVAGHRVLVRLPDGRFRVLAGTGKAGFSGDGGSAWRAELSGVSDLAVAPDGTLYIADGGRVRTVSRDGVIRTIAGSGRGAPLQRVANGTAALSAQLGSTRSRANRTPLALALSPKGMLYISTGSQILRLTSAAKLATVRASVTSGPFKGRLSGFGPIAVDGRGHLDVAGINGWSIWQVAPDGVAHEIGSGSGARRSGGGYSILERGPGGAVYGENGDVTLRIAGHRLVPTVRITSLVHGEYFSLTHFAFGPTGILYGDELPGDAGFEAHQQLVSIRGAHVRLLWQERNAGARDSFGPR